MLIADFAPMPLRLLPDRALLVLAERTHLVVADVHLGKSAAFRIQGLPVPEGDDARDLARLAALVREHRPDQLVVAGDLFHSDAGTDAALMREVAGFAMGTGIPFMLVSGNHDRKIRDFPECITVADEMDVGGLRIVHNPSDAPQGTPALCGHIHPVVKIPDGRKTHLRLPCFHLHGNLLTLPAFGGFTGGHIVRPSRGDRIFSTLRDEVIEIPEKLLTGK